MTLKHILQFCKDVTSEVGRFHGEIALTYLYGTGIAIAAGAITGEVLDWIPYISNAIPQGIAYVGNAFTDTDSTQRTVELLSGNLDKVGAATGMLRGVSVTIKH